MTEELIDEVSVNFIRQNKDYLAIKHYGLFLVFSGGEILKRFRTIDKAKKFAEQKKLELFVIWHFNELPERVVAGIMYDEEAIKKARQKALKSITNKNYYRKHGHKPKSAEKNRETVKKWYYSDRKKTLRLKKLWRLGGSAKSL